jgi:hypothetical protein
MSAIDDERTGRRRTSVYSHHRYASPGTHHRVRITGYASPGTHHRNAPTCGFSCPAGARRVYRWGFLTERMVQTGSPAGSAVARSAGQEVRTRRQPAQRRHDQRRSPPLRKSPAPHGPTRGKAMRPAAAHLREAGDTITEIVAKTRIRSSLYRNFPPRPAPTTRSPPRAPPHPAMTESAAGSDALLHPRSDPSRGDATRALCKAVVRFGSSPGEMG